MAKCWQNDPNARPTFVALRSELREMENEHKVKFWSEEQLELFEIVVFSSSIQQ